MPPSWLTAAAKRVGFEGNIDNKSVPTNEDTQMSQPHKLKSLSDVKLSLSERALSAAGAAVISAVIVNPLDVAKVVILSFLINSFSRKLFSWVAFLFCLWFAQFGIYDFSA